MTVTGIDAISSYHAHIYFDGDGERERASRLRERIGERFAVRMGRWHERPIGPHELPMYQVAFDLETFTRLLPWLMLNRDGLTVLVHPNTGMPRRDHLTHALWLGRKLEIIDPAQLPEQAPREYETAQNTTPTLPA